MEIESDKEYHRKAIALLICFFIAFVYVETVLKPYTQKDTPKVGQTSGQSAGQTGNQPGTQSSTTVVSNNGASPQTQAESQPAGSQISGNQISGDQTTTESTTTVVNAQQQSPEANLTQTGIPSDTVVKEAGQLSVTTESLNLSISLLGGRITELHLRDYKESLEEGAVGLNLVHHSENAPYPLGVYVGELNDAWVKYSVASGAAGSSLKVEKGQAPQPLILDGVLANGQSIRKTITFAPEGYLIDVVVDVPQSSAAVALEWNRFLPEDSASLLDPYNTQGFVWFDGEKGRREAAADFEEAQELGNVRWLSLSDKYFTATLLAKDEMLGGKALKTGNIYRARLSGTKSVSASLFAGPKSYDLLKGLGNRLELNIDFGKLALISAPLLGFLSALYGIFGNWGLAIVTLTLVVRLLLYPLNSASFKQMKKMQDLKPEMDKIREQYSDRQEQQMQLMAMYKKHNVNPVGGCLPMLLQMPVFFGLYSALMLAVELRHAPFGMWITDLSSPEKLMIAGIGIPVMVILFVISMVVQQATTPSQMDPTQKKMMMFMPVVMGFMFMNFPSGLTLYWLTSNLVSIGQQKGLYWAHDGGKSALKITLSVSAAVFVLAYLVTLF